MVEAESSAQSQQEQNNSSKAQDSRLVKLTPEEFEKFPGHYDDDGFYILDEGGFYDPAGFYYDKNGVDAIGGFYDSSGVYIAPKKISGSLTLNEDGRSVLCVKKTAEEIQALEGGAFDEDGFYIQADKSYYDPLGYYFDKDGYDTVGGKYDDEGYYMHPHGYEHEAEYGEDLEDYTLDDEDDYDYGEEDDQPQMNDQDFERQAVMHEHIMPAQLHVKTQLEQDTKSQFYVRVLNFPDLYQERNILRFLTKKAPEFNHTKLLMEKDRYGQFTGSVLIQASDRATINALLLLHDYKLQGHQLQTWLMGFEYEATTLQMMAAGTGSSTMLSDIDMGNMQQYEQLFSRVRNIEDRRKPIAAAPDNSAASISAAQNPEEESKGQAKPAMAKQTSVTTQDDEFEVVTQVQPGQQAAASKPKPAQTDDDEFQVTLAK